MPSYQYRDSHVKDKTVSPNVLSLTRESPYLGKTVSILEHAPGLQIVKTLGAIPMRYRSEDLYNLHNDVIKLKHFPRYWPFVRGIQWWPVDCTHKGQWRGALMFSLTCAWKNGWANDRNAGDLWCHRVHYDVNAMKSGLCGGRYSLHWRHNDHDSVSNHQPHGCLLNRLFRRRSKKTSKLCVTGFCGGNSPGPVNSPHKGPVTRKIFPFDDVIMSKYIN